WRGGLGKCLADGIRRRRVAHQQRAIVAQELDRATLAEVDRAVEPLEILEVVDGGNDSCELSIIVFKSARKDYPGAVLGPTDQWFADEEPRRSAIPLSYE